MIDTSNRRVRPNTELGRLVNFGTLENTNPILHPDGTVAQTVEYMKQIVREHHKDVAKIADKLYDPKLSHFLRNVFDFVMAYVKYKTDSAFTEQLRTPVRTLKDQKGDCDCMSILIGSILYNKNIPFYFRVSKYDVTRDFSHVYVVVPRNGDAGYYVKVWLRQPKRSGNLWRDSIPYRWPPVEAYCWLSAPIFSNRPTSSNTAYTPKHRQQPQQPSTAILFPPNYFPCRIKYLFLHLREILLSKKNGLCRHVA
jgi:hypothetical protein